MRALLVIVMIVASGRGGGADPSCKDAIEKAAKTTGRAGDRVGKMIELCEKDGWSVEMRRCMVGAANEDALKACLLKTKPSGKGGDKDGFDKYQRKAKKSEAMVQLDKIGKRAKEEYVTNARFPTAEAPLTPAVDCCTENHGGKRKCGPKPENWSTAAWKALDFQIDEPHFFRYSYKPIGGVAFVATAVGDLDCDGTAITYMLHGETNNGVPSTQITEPPPNSD